MRANKCAIFLMVVITSLMLTSGSAKVPLRSGESFQKSRIEILRDGWKPVVQAETNTEVEGNVKELLKAGYPEANECSGTGLNYCVFWYRRDNICLRLTTQGEYYPSNDSPKVHHWTVDEKCPVDLKINGK